MRLRRIEDDYGDRVDITWHGYPLVPLERSPRPISQHSIESRRRAAEVEPKAVFGPWDPSQMYPNGSMRALEAAKCAALQGYEAYSRFHWALFSAFFAEGKNISDPSVLIQVARASGLDVEAFAEEFVSCSQRQKVLAEYREAMVKYDVASLGVPLVIANDQFRMVGAATPEAYHELVEHFLAN